MNQWTTDEQPNRTIHTFKAGRFYLIVVEGDEPSVPWTVGAVGDRANVYITGGFALSVEHAKSEAAHTLNQILSGAEIALLDAPEADGWR